MKRSSSLLLACLPWLLLGCAAVYPPGVTVQTPARTATGGQPASGPMAATVPAALAAPPAEYRLQPGDQVAIRFPRRPAHSDTFTVRGDGRISPPLLESFVVTSLTADQLHDTLVDRYRRLLADLPPPQQRSYLLQPADLIEVRFSFYPDLNTAVSLRPDGRIALPMVGEVLAEGLTPAALQSQLQRQYTGKLPNPDLMVNLRESQSNLFYYQNQARRLPDPALTELSVNLVKTAPLVVYVGGEVPAPGIQPFMPGVNVLQTIYAAGGPTATADMRSVVILRRGPGDSMVRVVADLAQDLAGTGTGNLDIQPFDVVVLPRSSIARTGDALEQYLYRIVRPLANGSVVFNFTRQLGQVEQRTTVLP